MANGTHPAARVELVALDVDGVLTDGRIQLDSRGEELKSFHTHDGMGLRIWMQLGYQVAIITGRSSPGVAHRAGELGITHVFQGVTDKAALLDELLGRLGLEAAQAAAMGDDLPDLPMLRRAGYPMAVADAPAEVRAAAAFVTERPGGRGAVREAIEHLLKRRGRWNEGVALYDRPS